MGFLCVFLRILCASAVNRLSRSLCAASEHHPYVHEGGEQLAASVDIFEASAGNQRANTARDYDVVCQQGTILHAHTGIETYGMADVTLEEQRLQDFRAIEFGLVHVDGGAKFWRNLRVKCGIE